MKALSHLWIILGVTRRGSNVNQVWHRYDSSLFHPCGFLLKVHSTLGENTEMKYLYRINVLGELQPDNWIKIGHINQVLYFVALVGQINCLGWTNWVWFALGHTLGVCLLFGLYFFALVRQILIALVEQIESTLLWGIHWGMPFVPDCIWLPWSDKFRLSWLSKLSPLCCGAYIGVYLLFQIAFGCPGQTNFDCLGWANWDHFVVDRTVHLGNILV